MTEPLDDAAQHLKQAALEFIAAARALLDVAEEVVREPGGAASVIAETLTAIVGSAGNVTSPPSPKVEHIDVS